MRWKVEFATESFDLDEVPPHAVVAREIVQTAGLDAVDVGPLGTAAEGAAEDVLAVVNAMLRRTLEVGATRVSPRVNLVDPVGEGVADE